MSRVFSPPACQKTLLRTPDTPLYPAEALEASDESPTPEFKALIERIDQAQRHEYQKLRCVAFKKTYEYPVW